MFVNFGQLNPYPLCLVLGSAASLVEPLCRMLATVMAGQRGRNERGNLNTDKYRLLRAAKVTVISFPVCAASRANLNLNLLVLHVIHILKINVWFMLT